MAYIQKAYINVCTKVCIGAVLMASILVASCAYYNTFYNARKCFEEAEDARQGKARPQQRRPSSRSREDRQQRESSTTSRQTRSQRDSDSFSDPFSERGSSRDAWQSTPSRSEERSSASRASSSASANQLYDNAIKKAAKVLAFYPKSRWVDDTLLLMGQAFYWQEEYAKAARKFEELTVHFPKSKYVQEAYYWHGLSLSKMKRNEEAKRLFEKLDQQLDREGKSSFADNALLALAEIAFEEEDYRRVVSLCQRALAKFKKSEVRDQTLLLLGKAQFALEEYALAADAFRQAISRKPAPSLEYEARFMWGKCLKQEGKYNEAISLYSKLAKRGEFDTHAAELELEMADCYIQLGDTETALERYEMIVEDYPKSIYSAESCYRMGYFYETKLKDLLKAKTFYEKAKEQSPNGQVAEKAKVKVEDLSLLEAYLKEVLPALRIKKNALKPVSGDTAQVTGTATGTVKDINRADLTDTTLVAAIRDTTSVASEAVEDTVRLLASPTDSMAQGESALSIQWDAIPKTLLQLAELYLFRFEEPDSALKYYQYIADEFPADTLAPKAHYAIGWIQGKVLEDSLAAHTTFKRILDRYPGTDYARSARLWLGMPEAELEQEAADAAVEEFLALEGLRLGDAAPATYLPKFEKLARDHPGSPYAAQAAYVAAWTYDHMLQDSTRAHEAYEHLGEQFPDTKFAAVAKSKLNMLKEEAERAAALAQAVEDGLLKAAVEADTTSVDLTTEVEMGDSLSVQRDSLLTPSVLPKEPADSLGALPISIPNERGSSVEADTLGWTDTTSVDVATERETRDSLSVQRDSVLTPPVPPKEPADSLGALPVPVFGEADSSEVGQ